MDLDHYRCARCQETAFIRLEHLLIDREGKALRSEDDGFQCSGCGTRYMLVKAQGDRYEVLQSEHQPVQQAPRSMRDHQKVVSSVSAESRAVSRRFANDPVSQDPRLKGDVGR